MKILQAEIAKKPDAKPKDFVDLGWHLVFSTEEMRIVLCETTNAGQS
jgi:hypothetical protein